MFGFAAFVYPGDEVDAYVALLAGLTESLGELPEQGKVAAGRELAQQVSVQTFFVIFRKYIGRLLTLRKLLDKDTQKIRSTMIYC